MDTLISQAAGAGNLELCGVYLNRGRYVMTIFFIPLCTISIFIEGILIAFN